MDYTQEMLDELQILLLYDLSTMQAGVKVHASADPGAIAATRRLHRKGLLTQDDGGYLTSLGVEAAEHAHALRTILAPV